MRIEKRIQRLRDSPNNVKFTELCALAEAVGFEMIRTRGSHQQYRHRDEKSLRLNLQPRNGGAKPYQIRDFLDKVDRYNLLDG